jgi:dTDP-4-amino-4,6-dideoxygalactose transaminase
VQEFERKLAARLGVEHCIAICNGTIALEIAIRALDLSGEVIIPSLTFIATAHALQWQGITPVFCDVDPATHTIAVGEIERLITPRTTGIMGVHVWGQPCQIDQLTFLAERHRLKLLFDASHALGCTWQGRPIGNFGHAEIFSFHATKFLNTFEGGAVVTNDSSLARKIRLMKNFGFAGYDKVVSIGTNGKMSEISAAMGLTSLESIDEFIEANTRNYREYSAALAHLPGIQLFQYDPAEANNYQYIILTIDAAQAGMSRDALVTILQAENVIARRYFFPGCHGMEPYYSNPSPRRAELPVTERLVSQTVALPTGTAVGSEDIQRICGLIKFILAHHSELRNKLG